MQENVSFTMPTSQGAATSSKGLEEILSLSFEMSCKNASLLGIFKRTCNIAPKVAFCL